MSDKSYSEHLKDIRWRIKRKRIILRDDKKCTVCGSKNKLVVHHTFYYNDYREPWHYPDSSLLTLCEDCHNKYHREHELENKRPNEPVRNNKVKIIRPGVSGKNKRSTKSKKNKKSFKGYRDKKPSLMAMQAKRLGYINDGLGHWVKIR